MIRKIISAFIFLGILSVLGCISEEYSWYQRVTLIVPTDEGEVNGSSVMKITWRKNTSFLHPYPKWKPYIKGEMPVVKLPNGEYVFALMTNGYNHLPAVFVDSNLRTERKIEETDLIEITEVSPNSEICYKNDYFPHVVSFGADLYKDNVKRYVNSAMCIEVSIEQNHILSEPLVEKLLPWINQIKNSTNSHVYYELGEFNSDGVELKRQIVKHDFLRN